MNKLMVFIFIVTGILISNTVLAQDGEVQADVAISVNHDQEFWAGQQITLNLDLRTTGFSFSNSLFNLPEVNGAFLMQIDTTTIKLSERIDDESWQIVRYPLALYPQASGRLDIPPIDVRFTTSAGFGSTAKDFEFQTKPLELMVKLPPGIKDGALVVTTDSFELDYQWQPESATAKTGDAITLTVNRQAGDISAMLLPPLPVFETDGLAAYPQAPEISDKTNRGDLTGMRKDSIIWVVEKPGSYNIPGIRFQWWDPASQELKQQFITGLELNVLASPADMNTQTAAAAVEENQVKRFWLLTILMTIFIVGVVWSGHRKFRQVHKPNSEKAAFIRMQKACKGNQAGEAYGAIHSWLNHVNSHQSGSSGVQQSGIPTAFNAENELDKEMQSLQEAIVSNTSQWNGEQLAKLLKRIRQQAIRSKDVNTKTGLPMLNP